MSIQRRDMPGRVLRGVVAHPPANDKDRLVPIEEMWALSEEAWLLSGREIPNYRREEMPGRVIRPCFD